MTQLSPYKFPKNLSRVANKIFKTREMAQWVREIAMSLQPYTKNYRRLRISPQLVNQCQMVSPDTYIQILYTLNKQYVGIWMHIL